MKKNIYTDKENTETTVDTRFNLNDYEYVTNVNITFNLYRIS